MSGQQSFTFAFGDTMSADDFVVSPCNQSAYHQLIQCSNQLPPICILYGPIGCGKTHLAHIWAEKTNAQFISHHDLYHKELEEITQQHHHFILENIDDIGDEITLFHFYNHAKEHHYHVLMTCTLAPTHMNIRLPDLRSRLNATHTIHIDQPDDTLLTTLFVKYFTDQQLAINMDVISYLSTHVDRSFDAVRNLVKHINQQALKDHKKITVPFVKTLLSEIID